MEIKTDKEVTELISQIKLLLRISDTGQDALLNALLENAYHFAVSYTLSEEIPSAVLSRMVCEDFNRGTGVVKRARGGMSEEYAEGYSNTVLGSLMSLRRVRVI